MYICIYIYIHIRRERDCCVCVCVCVCVCIATWECISSTGPPEGVNDLVVQVLNLASLASLLILSKLFITRRCPSLCACQLSQCLLLRSARVFVVLDQLVKRALAFFFFFFFGLARSLRAPSIRSRGHAVQRCVRISMDIAKWPTGHCMYACMLVCMQARGPPHARHAVAIDAATQRKQQYTYQPRGSPAQPPSDS